MADSLSVPTISHSETQANSKPEPIVYVRRLVFTLAIATFFLMGLGSATRVMNAGLSCPDWPLCYGEVIPTAQMNLQVFLEWFHRLVASSVGFLTLIFAGLVWWFRRTLPKWLPWGATWAVFLVIFQGVLGGLTVTELLRFDIVTAHLGTGLLFFSSLLSITVALIPYTPNHTAGKLPWAGLTAAILVYLQSILGGLVASRWALHQCFANEELCAVMNSHLIGVVPASLAAIAVVAIAWKTAALHPILRRLSYVVGICLFAQVAIGYTTYKLHLQVEPLTVAHQATGAALLGALVCFTVLALRDLTRQDPEKLDAVS
ncbi:heme A synthase [Tumidithrix helvetica PCC 7403]|uniref:COX15/CtaA family protein n=1 Tax=Tumidithrix helvetica TaxID=3457545 RepID=UPI003C983506